MTTPTDVPDAWRSRFEFFDAYGLQTTTLAAREAYKALPITRRLRISSNFLAFLFGPIYFFVKGMWRKGLALLGITVAVGVAGTALDLPDSMATGIGTALGVLAMMTANYAYYLHVRADSRSWNPFEGWSRQS
ncbi:DUF2628 domain-containing protein [Mycobacterium koreense]|uniref:Uncharacterized protein n=1 Tax=Mycolicibacillus koreensis TaxID=1069220 RepID=A0A7I7SFI8_9MYCO|nr:DUF2628 domain-containing protein [Mycolicibacillus koreensis]MCV7248563.1 DUF2628 domain-containing protein [Mycolicibacillus koreensis]OSC32727.1 hypothetical protein B8W67_14650 [Mycolicibacillus koreensis]BBY55523.1 hypothetical protein MKOR_27740 [Mycolicibacillus koreensis]